MNIYDENQPLLTPSENIRGVILRLIAPSYKASFEATLASGWVGFRDPQVRSQQDSSCDEGGQLSVWTLWHCLCLLLLFRRRLFGTLGAESLISISWPVLVLKIIEVILVQ